jgi:hypothetical protein
VEYPYTKSLLGIVMTTTRRGAPLHLSHKVKQRMKASSRVIYPENGKWWISQREGRSSLRRWCPRPLFLALALSPAVQHRGVVIKASLLTPSWIFQPLLRHHPPAYDIRALIPRLHLRLSALCDGANLYCPPNEYHSHLRWDSPANHLTYRVRARHPRVSSFRGFL